MSLLLLKLNIWYNDYVAVYTLAAGRSCNDIHVILKCAVQGDGGGAYVLWSEAWKFGYTRQMATLDATKTVIVNKSN